jgi:hypothetical protein
MLKELKLIIEEAFRLGLTEALGGRPAGRSSDRSSRRSNKKRERTGAMPSPEEQAARATMHRISYS